MSYFLGFGRIYTINKFGFAGDIWLWCQPTNILFTLNALKCQKNENKIIEVIRSEATTATVQNHRERTYLHYFRGTNFCE